MDSHIQKRMHPYKGRLFLCPQKVASGFLLVKPSVFSDFKTLTQSFAYTVITDSSFSTCFCKCILFLSPFNLIIPHCAHRWKEENQSSRQWIESSLEWSMQWFTVNPKVKAAVKAALCWWLQHYFFPVHPGSWIWFERLFIGCIFVHQCGC